MRRATTQASETRNALGRAEDSQSPCRGRQNDSGGSWAYFFGAALSHVSLHVASRRGSATRLVTSGRGAVVETAAGLFAPVSGAHPECYFFPFLCFSNIASRILPDERFCHGSSFVGNPRVGRTSIQDETSLSIVVRGSSRPCRHWVTTTCSCGCMLLHAAARGTCTRMLHDVCVPLRIGPPSPLRCLSHAYYNVSSRLVVLVPRVAARRRGVLVLPLTVVSLAGGERGGMFARQGAMPALREPRAQRQKAGGNARVVRSRDKKPCQAAEGGADTGCGRAGLDRRDAAASRDGTRAAGVQGQRARRVCRRGHRNDKNGGWQVVPAGASPSSSM